MFYGISKYSHRETSRHGLETIADWLSHEGVHLNPTSDLLCAWATQYRSDNGNKDCGLYLDFDMYGVREDARGPLQANADYLKKWPSLRITVEGHCDERGTSEYNIALGERRSNAVKGYLVSLGVPESSITVISKGKETPFCTESNEACWQQNRRGHFVITAK